MKQHLLSYRSSSINYYSGGFGKAWLFCFHGYGEDGKSFAILEPHLQKKYKIVAIDLPFHGYTVWNEGFLFTPNDAVAIISKITGDSPAPISLLGFSIGGRIVLNLLPLLLTKIEKTVLLAPDGLREPFWYWFATQTKAGNAVFNRSMQQPALLFSLVGLAKALKLVSKSYYKFIHYYIGNVEARSLLYKRWTAFRKFNTDIHEIKDVVFAARIPVTMVFGRYDKVILRKTARYFTDGLEELVTITEVEAGHQLLKEKYAELIANFFYK